MIVDSAFKVARITQLNDHLRTTFTGGLIVTTAAFQAIEPGLKARILAHIRAFRDFNQDNDPHGEHDFMLFDYEDGTYFMKIDYYAPDMEHGSEDPADPEQTRRVMTIGLASDY